jgi:YHS domain-containing protein
MYGVYYNGMTYYFETWEQMNKFIEEFVEET